MSTFLGKYEAKADVKGRIFIPAAYRKILPEGEKDRVVMRLDDDNDFLVIYPESVWNKKMDKLEENTDEWTPEDELFQMQFVSEAEYLDIDSQGRILLSKKHLKSISIENSEVLFVGMKNKFTIWSKAKYEQTLMPRAEFAKLKREKMSRKTLTQDGE